MKYTRVLLVLIGSGTTATDAVAQLTGFGRDAPAWAATLPSMPMRLTL